MLDNRVIEEIELQIKNVTEKLETKIWPYMDENQDEYNDVLNDIDELKELVEAKIRILKNRGE